MNCYIIDFTFSALTLVDGQQKGILSDEVLASSIVMHTCIWPCWCYCHSLSCFSKSRLVLTFWYQFNLVVPEKAVQQVLLFLLSMVFLHCFFCKQLMKSGVSIPMGQGGHVPPIFMKGGTSMVMSPQYFRSDVDICICCILVLENLKVKNMFLNVYFAARFIFSSNSNSCCLS